MLTVFTITRLHLLGVHSVYRPPTTGPICKCERRCYPMSREGGLRPPFQNIGTSCLQQGLQLAFRMCLGCTVSTGHRLPDWYVRLNTAGALCLGKGAFGPLTEYWHLASTTCRQCLQLAGRIYLGCRVSVDHLPPDLRARVNVASAPCCVKIGGCSFLTDCGWLLLRLGGHQMIDVWMVAVWRHKYVFLRLIGDTSVYFCDQYGKQIAHRQWHMGQQLQ